MLYLDDSVERSGAGVNAVPGGVKTAPARDLTGRYKLGLDGFAQANSCCADPTCTLCEQFYLLLLCLEALAL